MAETLVDPVLPRIVPVENDLHLRRLQPVDAHRIFEILRADPEIKTRVTWVSGHNSVGDLQDTIEGFDRRQSPRYGIIAQEELVGYVGLFRSPISSTGYDMGYFCDPAARGRGYVPKAVATLMALTQSSERVSSFGLNIADDNIASQAVASKLGFVRTDVVIRDMVLDCDERRYERVVDGQN
ncbi:MAG TPA: GNAT family N-acetyltransferase [Candidatus Saccharimonadales bacterium]|nr:GNAT family N-acetyltransferase [Candidatus Saccharimonadales bacterium]